MSDTKDVRFHVPRGWVAARIGRRGLLLIIGGLAWIGIGVSQIRDFTERFSKPGPGVNWFLNFMDGQWTSYLWLGAGSIAFIIGMLHDRRKTRTYDEYGFSAMLTPPLLWVFGFAWSWFIFRITNGEEGRDTSLYALCIWVLVVLFIMVIAGWREQDPPVIVEVRELRDTE